MDYLRKPRSTKQKAKHLLSTPIIYSVAIPTVILDAFVEVYQQTCFRLYDIPINKRSQYIKIDRQKLKYLNLRQKLNCMYCGYMNGVFQYITKIAADTEKYWCGIKHDTDNKFKSPAHHKDFLPYNDKEAFEKSIKTIPLERSKQ